MLTISNWRKILTIAVLFATHMLFAQSEFRFRHFGIREGLGFEFVWGIAQDSLGYIWINNTSTMSRFDGYGFKIYRNNPEDSLRNALNFKLGRPIKDNNKNLWIPMTKHRPGSEFVAGYQNKRDAFVRHELSEIKTLVYEYLFEAGDSVIWLGTLDNTLYCYNIETRQVKNFLNTDANGKRLQPFSIGGIKDLGRSLLLGTEAGLWIFDKERKSYHRPLENLKDSVLLYNGPVNMILETSHYRDEYTWLKIGRSFIKIDSSYRITQRFDFPDGMTMDQWARDADGVFWLGGGWNQYAGLFRYDPRDSSLIQLRNDPLDPGSLRSNAINDVLVDSEENVWVATDVGVSVLRRRELKFYNKKLIDGTISCGTIIGAKDSEHLVLRNDPSPSKKLLISAINDNDLNSLKLEPKLDPIENFVGWMRVGKNTLWISAQGKGVIGYPLDVKTGMVTNASSKIFFHNPQNPFGLQSNAIWDIWEDANEDLWILQPFGLDHVRTDKPFGSRGSVTKYDRFGFVGAIFPEDERSFWAITDTSIFLVHLPMNRNDSASFEQVFDNKIGVILIYKSNDGTRFFGTSTGLVTVRKEGGRFVMNDRVSNNVGSVNSIQEDEASRLWIDSDINLLCHDPRTGVTAAFDERDGIDYFRYGNPDRMRRFRNGKILVFGSEGITVFDPSDFQFSRRKVVPVLTNLQVNNKNLTGRSISNDAEFMVTSDIGLLNELILDYKHNDFTVEFSAMEMAAPEKNKYRHKLEGYDDEWIETDFRNRIATYTNLDAGEYTFKVKASNHHGIWSDVERTLKIKVLPPPWKSTWAYTAYSIIFLGLLFAARRSIVNRERLKSNLKLAKVEQEKEHFELEKAKEVDKVKSTFFANISHEFRTPLTLIKGPVQEMMEEFGDHPKVKARMSLVQRNADLVLKLINQLLDLAKLDSGTLTVERTISDFNSFLSAVVNSFSSLAFQKNIELTTKFPTTPYLVTFDKDKVETVLINLINNAMKFTPGGGKVDVRAEYNSNLQVVIIVSDNGIGIPEDQQGKVFERFHQVSDAHKEVGTGIGLALVKELVALMHGTISLKSEPGEGSVFTITLPIEQLNLITGQESVQTQHEEFYNVQTTIVEAEHRENGHDQRSHILIVEDNTDLRKFIIDSLGQEFYFLEAADGKKGMEKAFEFVPDVIVSDVMMPEMDGITMTEKLKKDTRTSHIPLILLTAKTTDESKLQGLGTGADDYLTKPFNKNELLLKVRNSIASRVRLREKIKLELLKEGPKTEAQSADEKFLYGVRKAILSRLNDGQLSVESLAEEMALSRSQLLRKITALTGMSVNELIRTFRLQKAAQLLEQDWGPVTQVAYEVGFSNLSYFSRAFKDKYGVLPSDYAKKTI